jgi:hypothetical protein
MFSFPDCYIERLLCTVKLVVRATFKNEGLDRMDRKDIRVSLVEL